VEFSEIVVEPIQLLSYYIKFETAIEVLQMLKTARTSTLGWL